MRADLSSMWGVPTCAINVPSQLDSALDTLGIARNVPAIILIGGASGMTDVQSTVADRAIREGIGPAAAEAGATVIDGGTDAGVMRLAGQTRIEQGFRFALVGVVGDRFVRRGADQSSEPIPLEPNHSGIVTVPGSRWGDETPWLFDLAQLIAGSRPIRTVLVNGGSITRQELAESMRRSIPVIVIRGTGRAADDLDAADVFDGPTDPYDGSLISVIEAGETEELRSMLREALRIDGPSGATGGRRGEGSEDGARS